jgi:chlorobactene glucosyltransferase
VFVDCDTVLAPEGLGRLASIVDDYDADVVTAAPRQVTGSLPEHLVVPLLQLTWLAWLPLPLVWRSRDPRFLVAVGQVLAFRRAAYARIGGHAAVRGELVEDMAICRRAKEQALRVVFADGHHIATCRMYGSARELWQGFSKNLYEGLGNKPSALVVVVALYLLAFVVPYAALPARAAVVGVALNVVLRVGLALRLRTRLATQLFSAVLHPLGVLVVVAIALNSALWTWRGALSWSGRVYAPRERRS